MSKTANLGLNLTEDESTDFSVWRESIDGNGETDKKSNMQIIDEFAGAIYGKSGTITLSAPRWSGGTYTVPVPQLGADDAVFLTPSTQEDQIKAEGAGLFAQAKAGSITVTAKVTPAEDITMNYFISRGKL